jgi:hypothetical protein
MQPLSLIPMALVALVMERVRRIYTPAARDVKRLESLSMNFLIIDQKKLWIVL